MEFLSVTAVRYRTGDLVGKGLALVSLAPIFLIAQLAALVAVRRDWPTLVLLLGQLLNDQLNGLVKHQVRQPRPLDCELESYGMPSNHAQFMGFLLSFTGLYLCWRCACSRLEKAFWATGTAGLTVLVCISRVYLLYHTTEQVLVGLGLGFLAGAGWFLAFTFHLESLGAAAAASWVGRALLLKDHSRVRNVAVFEWESLQQLRATSGGPASIGGGQGFEASGNELPRQQRRRRRPAGSAT
uniref:Phosphatidic acid phosphatase type 2/haloperoxidase domain-containing protein n=1 Tax=Rhizochromulina marina TaxID=1034831 RepID=A0A7S2S7W1_9STRA|mmetsp:Transcript_26357/g.76845  ORF Transcript_26357/g.76845 Transcript_26357/m.76845 type:complete len:241 (+) Transcript_26357:2-724(+)